MSLSTPNFKQLMIEDVLESIKSVLTTNLNSFVAQMNVDRDDLVLPTLDSDAFYTQSLSEGHVNHDPFCLIAEQSVQVLGDTHEANKSHDVLVAVCISGGNRNSRDLAYLLFRYRAILEVMFEKASHTELRQVSGAISSLSPFVVQLGRKLYYAAAINYRVQIV